MADLIIRNEGINGKGDIVELRGVDYRLQSFSDVVPDVRQYFIKGELNDQVCLLIQKLSQVCVAVDVQLEFVWVDL